MIAIDVWSDVVCPWCYLGKRRLERALGELGEEGFEVRWHAFQLQPDAPRFGQPGAGAPVAEYLRERGYDPEQVEAMQVRVTELAAAEGLEYRLERSHHVNTLEAHRLIRAADPETAAVLVESLFRAQLVEGRRIDDPAVLAELAAAAGLAGPDERARADAAAAVAADLDAARQLGIGGVPFFVFDRRLALSGAQPLEVFRAAATEAAGSAEAAPG